MAAGILDADPLISRPFGLEAANDALAAALDRAVVTGVPLP
jgi:hypothetical protein